MPLDYETLPTIESIIDTLIELLILPTDTWTDLQLQDLQTIHKCAINLQGAWWELTEANSLEDAHIFLAYSGNEFFTLRTSVNSMIGFSRVILKGIDGVVPSAHQPAIEKVYNDSAVVLHKINTIWQRRIGRQG
jgi:hypothetical protein